MLNPDEFLIQKHERERYYRERVRPSVFEGVETVRDPAFILYAGQHGSGKSTLMLRHAEDLANEGRRPIIVDGNRLRELHPNNKTLVDLGVRNAARVLSDDISFFKEMVLRDALKLSCCTLLSDVMRKLDWIIEQTQEFSRAKFLTEARVLAVKPEFSRHSAIERVLQGGNDISSEQHSQGCDNTMRFVRRVEAERLVRHLGLYRRNGEVIYANRLTDGGGFEHELRGEEALAQEWIRPQTLQERAKLAEAYDEIAIRQKLSGRMSPEEASEMQRLSQDAHVALGAVNAESDPRTSYSGRIGAVTARSVYQEIRGGDRTRIIRHDRSAFTKVPEIDEFVVLEYRRNWKSRLPGVLLWRTEETRHGTSIRLRR
jgi:Zeta toxin